MVYKLGRLGDALINDLTDGSKCPKEDQLRFASSMDGD